MPPAPELISDDGIRLVGLARQHLLQLELSDWIREIVEHGDALGHALLVVHFLGQLEHRLRVLERRTEILEGLHRALESRLLLEDDGRVCRVVPEGRVSGLLVELRDSTVQTVDVKDAPERRDSTAQRLEELVGVVIHGPPCRPISPEVVGHSAIAGKAASSASSAAAISARSSSAMWS